MSPIRQATQAEITRNIPMKIALNPKQLELVAEIIIHHHLYLSKTGQQGIKCTESCPTK